MIRGIFRQDEYLVRAFARRCFKFLPVSFSIDGADLEMTLKVEGEHRFLDKWLVWKVFGVAVHSRVIKDYMVESEMQGHFLFAGAEHVFPILDKTVGFNNFLSPDPTAIPYKRFVLQQRRFIVSSQILTADIVSVWDYLDAVERELQSQIISAAKEYIRKSAIEQGFKNIEV